VTSDLLDKSGLKVKRHSGVESPKGVCHDREETFRVDRSGDSSQDPQEVHRRREDPHRFWKAFVARRALRVVPSRGDPHNLYYKWSKEFLEAGKQRLVGDIKRQATSTEVTSLRRENQQLKELVPICR